MDSNLQVNPARATSAPAGIAQATVRALPWLAPSPSGRCSLMVGTAARGAAQRTPALAYAPVGYAAEMPVDYGTYATTIDQDVLVLSGWDADHKFSTRLGPTASPPV